MIVEFVVLLNTRNARTRSGTIRLFTGITKFQAPTPRLAPPADTVTSPSMNACEQVVYECRCCGVERYVFVYFSDTHTHTPHTHTRSAVFIVAGDHD